MNLLPFSSTPAVAVSCSRGMTVRAIAYYRHPDATDITEAHVTRYYYDARGFLTHSADPRLYGSGLTNFTYVTGLAGILVRTSGVDNGTTVTLNDADGRPCLAVSSIHTADGGADDSSQALTRLWQYEEAALPGRLLSVTEQISGGDALVVERTLYAGNTDAQKSRNQAGSCFCRYDTAGMVHTDGVALNGVPISVTRRLLKDADSADSTADWQGDESSWSAMLSAEPYPTLTIADATGAVLTVTDARGNRQRVTYDVAGRLSASWFSLKGGAQRVIIASLTWSAAGQTLREAYGNGVVTTCACEPRTQRLSRIITERPAGHPSGAEVLQDLRYGYDPVGNVLRVRNDAEQIRFWRSRKVVPENTYGYDSLYRLVRATGREMANASRQSSNFSPVTIPLHANDSAYADYNRTFTYDNAGNLTQIRHHALATGNSYTTSITVSSRSNRGVLNTLTEDQAEVDALFTAGGQQTRLMPGQALSWTPRGELMSVAPVSRRAGPDDRESYRYDAGSQRILKVSVQQTSTGPQTRRVVYLPHLELKRVKTGESETESLQVITAGGAARAQVRVLHWENGTPAGLSNDQVRWNYGSLNGSSGLELDDNGNIISLEEYYPFGGTAVWAARSAAEADYKTVRYSGKERDATGLYCYGYRYYQPWAGRWLSADPAGTIDGLNLFRMCRNNPVTFYDKDGLAPEGLQQFILENHHKFATKELSFNGRPAWDIGGFDPDESAVIEAAQSAGFTFKDFEERNKTVKTKNSTSALIRAMRTAPVDTYITSSSYYNNPLRARLNPVHIPEGQQHIPTMNDIIGKYMRESEDAAYSSGISLKTQTEAMHILGRREKMQQIFLLEDYLSDNKKYTETYRGLAASPLFIKDLDYQARKNAVLKTDQFFSTTKNYAIAHEFASGKYDALRESGDSKVIFEIQGSSGARISAFLDEEEVLYPPETCFQISSGNWGKRLFHLGAKVYNLREVTAPAERTKIPFLSDTGKTQRFMMRQN